MDQSSKEVLHKIWDKHQVFDIKFIRKYLGVQNKINLDELRKEFRNWLGGDRVVYDKAHKLLSQKQRARVGGYDFEFKPYDWVINTTDPNVTVYVDSCYVDPYGQVTLFGEDGGTYDIGEVISGEEFSTGEMGDVSSEVKYEIKEIVNDQLKDLLLKNCGVQLIPFPDIIYNSKPFDKPLREHIPTELDEKYYDEDITNYDEDITKSFELVINKLLKRKYEWFYRIIINKLSYSKDSNYLGINAELFADEDWVGHQWREHYYSTPIPSETEDTPISLGDIISGELSKELQGHFKNVFKIIASEKKPKYMSWSWINVIPVEMNDKKLQESIRRILREEVKIPLSFRKRVDFSMFGDINESILKEETQEDFIPLEDLNTVIEDYEGGFDVFIMDGDKKIGEISFAEEDKPNQYTISDARIDDEYKGNRIYPKTIISLFKEKPNIIINSVFRSPEAQKAWIYLLSNLPPNIGKSVKYYKDEDTTLFQLKSRNLQESIRRILREELASREVEVQPEVFYSFANLPNKYWISDKKDMMYPEEFFDDKNFEEYQFDNFFDMDQMFGHKNSPFGTKGLEVGDPKRTSRSFDMYNSRFGPAVVRVIPNKIKMETTESELTERCWKGYTQKGMKTMFGKRYPNCVKIKKK